MKYPRIVDRSLAQRLCGIVGFLLVLSAGSHAWAQQSCSAVNGVLANSLANTALSPKDNSNYQYTSGGSTFTASRGTGTIKLPIPLLGEKSIKANVTLVSCGSSLAYVVVEGQLNDLLDMVVPDPLKAPMRAINPSGAVLVFNLTNSEIDLDKVHGSLRWNYENQLSTVSSTGVRTTVGIAGVKIPRNGVALLMSADVSDIMEKTAGQFLSGNPGKVRIQFQNAQNKAEFGMTLLGMFALKPRGIENLKLKDPAFSVEKTQGGSSTTFSGGFYFDNKHLGNAAVTKTATSYSADIALEPLDLGMFDINSAKMILDMGSGTGTLSGQIKGSPVFSSVNAEINGNISPVEITLTTTADFLGSNTALEFKGPMASFSNGQGVTLKATISSPNFASALTQQARDAIGATGVFSKVSALLDMGNPLPTIKSATLKMTLGGNNPSGTMSVKGSVFGQGFTTGDVEVSAQDMSSSDKIASKISSSVVSAAVKILDDKLIEFMNNPAAAMYKLVGSVVPKAGETATEVIRYFSCLFGCASPTPPPLYNAPKFPSYLKAGNTDDAVSELIGLSLPGIPFIEPLNSFIQGELKYNDLQEDKRKAIDINGTLKQGLWYDIKEATFSGSGADLLIPIGRIADNRYAAVIEAAKSDDRSKADLIVRNNQRAMRDGMIMGSASALYKQLKDANISPKLTGAIVGMFLHRAREDRRWMERVCVSDFKPLVGQLRREHSDNSQSGLMAGPIEIRDQAYDTAITAGGASNDGSIYFNHGPNGHWNNGWWWFVDAGRGDCTYRLRNAKHGGYMGAGQNAADNTLYHYGNIPLIDFTNWELLRVFHPNKSYEVVGYVLRDLKWFGGPTAGDAGNDNKVRHQKVLPHSWGQTGKNRIWSLYFCGSCKSEHGGGLPPSIKP